MLGQRLQYRLHTGTLAIQDRSQMEAGLQPDLAVTQPSVQKGKDPNRSRQWSEPFTLACCPGTSPGRPREKNQGSGDQASLTTFGAWHMGRNPSHFTHQPLALCVLGTLCPKPHHQPLP